MKRLFPYLLLFSLVYLLLSCNDSDPIDSSPIQTKSLNADDISTEQSSDNTPYILSIKQSPARCFAPGSQILYTATPSVAGNYRYNWSVSGPSTSYITEAHTGACFIDFGPLEGSYMVSCSITDLRTGLTSPSKKITSNASEGCPRY